MVGADVVVGMVVVDDIVVTELVVVDAAPVVGVAVRGSVLQPTSPAVIADSTTSIELEAKRVIDL
ncbi:MAG TPA: hypothetical protein VJQ79_04310 [Acidimicrobiia bacterium]|nr:hypothetical protein [Acidimicrobiia bacterium]